MHHYKEGKTERVIYERVNGMRKINSILSTLYNFSSNGPFPETPLKLYGPSAAEAINKF